MRFDGCDVLAFKTIKPSTIKAFLMVLFFFPISQICLWQGLAVNIWNYVRQPFKMKTRSDVVVLLFLKASDAVIWPNSAAFNFFTLQVTPAGKQTSAAQSWLLRWASPPCRGGTLGGGRHWGIVG